MTDVSENVGDRQSCMISGLIGAAVVIALTAGLMARSGAGEILLFIICAILGVMFYMVIDAVCADRHALADADADAKSAQETTGRIPVKDTEAAAAEPTPAPAAAPVAEAAPKAEPATTVPEEGQKPKLLDAPEGGAADDLKRIKGVGPKLEEMLNKMGVFHFSQIASWSASEIAWVDQNLESFKGRASRDSWVDQANVLAEGGETDFSKRVDGGDVPSSQ